MSSTLKLNGANTSTAEVLVITKNGILLSIPDGEFFMPYTQFPWFKDARVSDVMNVEFDGEDLRWDALDVDLHIESVIHPEKYPLIYNP